MTSKSGLNECISVCTVSIDLVLGGVLLIKPANDSLSLPIQLSRWLSHYGVYTHSCTHARTPAHAHRQPKAWQKRPWGRSRKVHRKSSWKKSDTWTEQLCHSWHSAIQVEVYLLTNFDSGFASLIHFASCGRSISHFSTGRKALRQEQCKYVRMSLLVVLRCQFFGFYLSNTMINQTFKC